MYTAPRNMPSKIKVAANVGLDLGVCFRCGKRRPTERAHIIDRCAYPEDADVAEVDGLNNVVPLCRPCHSMQPPFDPGEDTLAWAWLQLDRETYVRDLINNHPMFSEWREDWIKMSAEWQASCVEMAANGLDWPEECE